MVCVSAALQTAETVGLALSFSRPAVVVTFPAAAVVVATFPRVWCSSRSLSLRCCNEEDDAVVVVVLENMEWVVAILPGVETMVIVCTRWPMTERTVVACHRDSIDGVMNPGKQNKRRNKEKLRETVRNTTRGGFSRFQTKANQTKTKQKRKSTKTYLIFDGMYWDWTQHSARTEEYYRDGMLLLFLLFFVLGRCAVIEKRGEKGKKNPTHTNCGCNGRTNGTVGTCTSMRLDAASLHTCSFAVATELLLMSSLLLLLMMNECHTVVVLCIYCKIHDTRKKSKQDRRQCQF